MTQPRIGYIGLGVMGSPMARNLIKAGYPLTVFDIRREKVDELISDGAQGASSPAGVARRSDYVFSSLPGQPEVLDAYLGENGVRDGAHPGLIAADMSTVPPSVTRRVAEALAAAEAEMVDAPVARTREAAIAGTLSIMVGGTDRAFERVLPIMRSMGSSVIHLGALGSGNVAKLLNNAVLMSNIVTVAEALVVGGKAGADVKTLVQVLSEGSADSFALRNHIAKSVLSRDFAEDRFPLAYALKDLEYFFDLCRDTESVCLQISTTRELYHATRNRGNRLEYFPVVAELIGALGGGDLAIDRASAR